MERFSLDKAVEAVNDLFGRGTVTADGADTTDSAGHSLRAGLATAAAQTGVAKYAVRAQTRHKSLLILRRYIRDGSRYRENVAAKVRP